jgi:hypothetical protein
VDFPRENVTEDGFFGELGSDGDEMYQISQVLCEVEWGLL